MIATLFRLLDDAAERFLTAVVDRITQAWAEVSE